MSLTIDGHLSIESLYQSVIQGLPAELSDEAKGRIRKCRLFLDDYLKKEERPIYGINTGFGSLCDVAVSNESLTTLQENLIMSHACGAGNPIDPVLVRLMLLLKVQGLSQGHSGVHLETVEALLRLYNEDVLPVVYDKGSLGASGDLAPLAHIGLVLLGQGEVWQGDEIRPTMEVYEEKGWEPLRMHAKEGLAILNGTQFMSAHGVWLCNELERLFTWGDFIAALTLDAFHGHLSPFYSLVHDIRPHKGQSSVAARVRSFLEGSRYVGQPKEHVQDPYCVRCVPQVHGASWDALEYAKGVLQTEVDAVTDNPTIFPEQEVIISAGNFHGQPLALIFDQLAIAMAEMGSISERRTYKLNMGHRGLPSFLIEDAGLNSGFMIAQYTAASLVSENKQLCTPASVDTIDSSQGQEDHVSMGANAATKAGRVMNNLEEILAIELVNAAQALELRGIEDSSPAIKKMIGSFREMVPFVEEDRPLYPLFWSAKAFMREYELEA